MVALSLALAVALGVAARRVAVQPPASVSQETAASTVFEPPPALAEAPWDVLRAGGDPSAPEGSLSRRFRLAGTLFGYGVGSVERPQAILDDKLLVVQRLVRRGEEVLPGIRLVEVHTDAVVLEGPQGREELRIERTAFSAAPSGGAATAAANVEAPSGQDGRFGGGQVFPGRWEFRRDALLRYYAELRDQPERLLAVFDSMEPLYESNDPATRTITGYRLNVRGEAPLFEAMGLNPGDVVRSVNSVPMTNRRRAEEFIRSFVEDNEDTFVFEVERGGAMTKQVYIIR